MNEIKYYKQGRGQTCGPLTLLNAMRFMGKPTSLKMMPRLKREMKYDRGVHTHDFERAARKYGIRRIQRPSFPRIRQHLLRGHAVIVEIQHERKRKVVGRVVTVTLDGHLFLLAGVGVCDRQWVYHTVNLTLGENWYSEAQLITPPTGKKLLFSGAWLVTGGLNK
jgi:hypothetical protein